MSRAIDYAGLVHPKEGKVRPSVDKRESEKVKTRSGGICEVIAGVNGNVALDWQIEKCPWKATQIHHMIGGRGKRGRGISALAQHKQHVCDRCHEEITGGVGGKKLIRVGGAVPQWDDIYRRVR